MHRLKQINHKIHITLIQYMKIISLHFKKFKRLNKIKENHIQLEPISFYFQKKNGKKVENYKSNLIMVEIVSNYCLKMGGILEHLISS